jgi:hypothetical protein
MSVKNFPFSQDADAWHSKRAADTEPRSSVSVGGVDIPETEIVDLWHSSNEGDYLHLIGDRKFRVPKEEVDRVRDFLEERNFSIGLHRNLKIGGRRVLDKDVFDVVEKDGKPFVVLSDGNVIEAKPPEIYALRWVVERNNKIRNVISESNLNSGEIETLRRLIGDAIQNSVPAPQLIINIQNEVPKASGLAQFFTGNLNFTTLLGIVLMILTWMYPQPPPEPKTKPGVSAPSTSKRSVRRDRPKGKPKQKRVGRAKKR